MNVQNPFKIGDHVRVVLEGKVTDASVNWGRDVGYINVDTPLDVHNFDFNEIVSVDKIEPPFVFPKTPQAVVSGVHREKGDRQYFHRNVDRWVALHKQGVTAFWSEAEIVLEYYDLTVEWSGV